MDERTYFRNYGRSLKNMPCEVAAPFIRGHRFSLLPAMDNGWYICVQGGGRLFYS